MSLHPDAPRFLSRAVDIIMREEELTLEPWEVFLLTKRDDLDTKWVWSPECSLLVSEALRRCAVERRAARGEPRYLEGERVVITGNTQVPHYFDRESGILGKVIAIEKNEYCGGWIYRIESLDGTLTNTGNKTQWVGPQDLELAPPEVET